MAKKKVSSSMKSVSSCHDFKLKYRCRCKSTVALRIMLFLVSTPNIYFFTRRSIIASLFRLKARSMTTKIRKKFCNQPRQSTTIVRIETRILKKKYLLRYHFRAVINLIKNDQIQFTILFYSQCSTARKIVIKYE